MNFLRLYVYSFLLSLCLVSCNRIPYSPAYIQHYAYLKQPLSKSSKISYSDYFLVILVDARHLDYTNSRGFFRTLSKHPSDGSKNGDVGHAWIYLEGWKNHQRIGIEGGQSGEIDESQPKYFEGVMNYAEFGYLSPTSEQLLRYEPNPIKYLWEPRHDGFFQEGSGRHRPTFAAKVDLTFEQFNRILEYIDPENYDYSNYSITDHQCSSFVSNVAALAGLQLDSALTMNIDPVLDLGSEKIPFWKDSKYAKITFPTPDVVECSLMKAVSENRAEYALDWYLQNRYKPKLFWENWEDITRLPNRSCRSLSFK